MSGSELVVFLGAAVAVTLAPGPDNLFILTLGATQGRRPALALAWGMSAGNAVHTAAVALGLAGLPAASPALYGALRVAGVLYLLWLAAQAFRAAARPPGAAASVAAPTRLAGGLRWFRRGLLMNLLNPKVLVFFLAFLPQFVPADSPRPALVVAFLGSLFIAQVLVLFSALALAAGSLQPLWVGHPTLARGAHGLTGSVLLLLAAWLWLG